LAQELSPVEKLGEYVRLARSARTHEAKVEILVRMLHDVFGAGYEDLLSGIETKVSIKGIRGSIDLLHSGVVFEVKVDLGRELGDAERELQKYFQILLEKRPGERFVGIATDLLRYMAYLPVVDGGRVVGLRELSSLDVSKEPLDDVFLWLDSYVFSNVKVKPTARALERFFGPESRVYGAAKDELARFWERVGEREDVKLRYRLWLENMKIVYGGEPGEEVFVEQTYLVTLVKLIVFLWLSGGSVSSDKVLDALTGEYFRGYGVANLVEEDFFSWILVPEVRREALDLSKRLVMELLSKYDLSDLDEDFFKEIYEAFVKREQRQRLGEYYTPEWLAELVFEKALEYWGRTDQVSRILDPACGSGTFLSVAIRRLKSKLRERGLSDAKILETILRSVVGVDVNPLAVVIARANYLLALGGDLLSKRSGSIVVPVYVADSIRVWDWSEKHVDRVPVYEYSAEGTSFWVPLSVARDRERLSAFIDALRKAVDSYRRDRNASVAQGVFEKALEGVVGDAERKVLLKTLDAILSLMDAGRDSVWVYMLSNVYVPVALSASKFDIVVGNPPWVTLNKVGSADYQDFLKRRAIEYRLVEGGKTRLFSSFDISQLFYAMCADLYLDEAGAIAFVMPRTVLWGAKTFEGFKRFLKGRLKLVEVLDLKGVKPLFSVDSCVLVSVKWGSTEYPVSKTVYKGRLPARNVKLSEALKYLEIFRTEYSPVEAPRSISYYYVRFRKGAYIAPRQFFFVKFDVHPSLGVDLRVPRVGTADLLDEKEPWRGIRLEGNVEPDFIYVTLLSRDMHPFGFTELRPVVLPAEPSKNGFRLLTVEELRRRGFVHAAEWFERVEKLWRERSTEKAKRIFPNISSYINYQRLMELQNPEKRYAVLYNAIGGSVVSCVLDRKSLPEISLFGGVSLKPRGFVADHAVYLYETDDELEAHYLCAVLNSRYVSESIKPFKSERNVGRSPFMLPIPRFNPGNPEHVRLARLSKTCHRKVKVLRLEGLSTVERRKRVREALKEELAEIDGLVRSIMSSSGTGRDRGRKSSKSGRRRASRSR